MRKNIETERRPKRAAVDPMDRFFQWLFKILLATVGVLFAFQTVLVRYGTVWFICLLALAGLLCLRLRKTSSRLAATLLVFFVLSDVVNYAWSHSSPASLVIVIGSMSIAAYYIREFRRDRKPVPFKTHGAERTPVFPPEEERA